MKKGTKMWNGTKSYIQEGKQSWKELENWRVLWQCLEFTQLVFCLVLFQYFLTIYSSLHFQMVMYILCIVCLKYVLCTLILTCFWSDWLICRVELHRRSSMNYINLDLGRDKEHKSETNAWPNQCRLGWNPWGRIDLVGFVQNWQSWKRQRFCDW